MWLSSAQRDALLWRSPLGARRAALRRELGAIEDNAQAFEGCSNRLRVAAVVTGARFTGTLQGIAIGVVVGTIGGVLLYMASQQGDE